MLLFFVIFALLDAVYIKAVPILGDATISETTNENPLGDYEGWLVPQINGAFEWMSADELALEMASTDTCDIQIIFNLYTNNNPNNPEQIPFNDALALASSNYNKSNPTRVVIHGWINNCNSAVNVDIIPALFASGTYNVICVDWSSAASNIFYPGARNDVPCVGLLVAQYFDFLSDKGGMLFSDLHCIGHSLGAHVCGHAGKNVQRGIIEVIIGLDPALPLFSYSDCSARLCITDANHVDSIHTNGGKLGFLDPIGENAFYVNGGRSQPGCKLDLTGMCSHERAHTYYAEALRNNSFLTYKCSSYSNAIENNCDSAYSSIRMGSASSYGTDGYYYVPVKEASPFGYAS